MIVTLSYIDIYKLIVKMSLAIILSMFVFSLSMSISPGPVNITILSTSLNHGFIKTFPFISGATIGFVLLLISVGFGFSKIINTYPIIFSLLEFLGAFFIIYIGYKILSSKPEIEVNHNSSIPNFIDGFLLQWLNPKAWIACASGNALFSAQNTNTPLIVFICIYFLICYLSLAIWGALGEKLSIALSNSKRILLFNRLMGFSLIFISIYMIFNIFTVK